MHVGHSVNMCEPLFLVTKVPSKVSFLLRYSNPRHAELPPPYPHPRENISHPFLCKYPQPPAGEPKAAGILPLPVWVVCAGKASTCPILGSTSTHAPQHSAPTSTALRLDTWSILGKL